MLSGHRDCFLGKEICISFLVNSTVMLWIDFIALAAEKMITIMRQRYVEIEGKAICRIHMAACTVPGSW